MFVVPGALWSQQALPFPVGDFFPEKSSEVESESSLVTETTSSWLWVTWILQMNLVKHYLGSSPSPAITSA